MGFSIANYEMEGGGSRPIKVDAATITTANPNFATASSGSFVRTGGSKRSYGTVARQLILSRAIGEETPYASGSVSVSVPILTKAAFAAAAIGGTYTYGGLTDWVIVSKQPESSR